MQCKYILSLMLVYVFAQTQEIKPETQFDFWLGEWELSWKDKEGNNQSGKNKVERILGGKVIQENFNGTTAIKLVGKSWSVYNNRSGKWHQTWVDNEGSYLDFSGEFKEGKMILSRSFTSQDKTVFQRMVWYNIAADSFDWSWQSSPDGEVWKVNWQIRYERKR